MAPAQMRGATGEIRIPDEVREGDYDLICVGSPTWFFRPSVPIRSFLKSGAAGRLLDGKRFTAFVVCRRYGSINLRAVRKLGTNRAAWPHCGDTQVNGNHPARVIRAHPSWATMNRTSKGVARVRRRRKLRDPDQGAAE
jgi:multimeric flavodoxin WrbA